MSLIDMKLPKKTKAEREKDMAVGYPGEGEKYPYGLRLTFNKDEIEKLAVLSGIEANAPFSINAEGYISEVSVTDRGEGKGKERSRHRVEAQITKIDIVDLSDKGLDWDTTKKDADKVLDQRGLLK